MTETLISLLEVTIEVSLLVLLVLVLREPIARFSNVRWAYLIWILPAVRLSMALLPAELSAIPAAVAQSMDITLGAWSGNWLASLPAVPAGLAGMLLGFWIVGMLVMGTRLVVAQAQFRRRLVDASRPLSTQQRKLLGRFFDRMQVFPMIDCRLSEAVKSPVLLGVIKPLLALPADFFESSREPELVIRHELVHFRRRDLWANLIVAIVRCVFWFNPLLTWAERRFRDDQEMACDRVVLEDESPAKLRGYAAALVGAAGGREALSVAFVSTEPAVTQRTRALVRHRRSYLRDARGGLVAAVLLMGTLIVGVDSSAVDLTLVSPLTFPGPIPGTCGG